MSNRVELPDIENMFLLIGEITELSKKKAALELELKLEEMKITRLATTDKRFFVNSKVPSQTYIDNTWKVSGFDNELVDRRKELNNISADLESKRMTLELYKKLIDVYRTQSANERYVS